MTAPTVASTLHVTHGITEAEFAHVVATLGRLDERLRSFRADAVELHLGVKERDTVSQRTTLEARIAGRPRLVATSDLEELDSALIEVRDDLIRQITDAKNRSEPKNNPSLRQRG